MPCSFGFRPKRTARMALSAMVQSVNEDYLHVVDVDLKSYFDTIDHELLLKLVARVRATADTTPDPGMAESRCDGRRQGDASRSRFTAGWGDLTLAE